MKLMPGLGERWLAPQLAPPARPLSGDPAAALPQRLTAVDAAEQAELELGGAITALRRRGYAWIAITRAVDLPLAEVRVLARR